MTSALVGSELSELSYNLWSETLLSLYYIHVTSPLDGLLNIDGISYDKRRGLNQDYHSTVMIEA